MDSAYQNRSRIEMGASIERSFTILMFDVPSSFSLRKDQPGVSDPFLIYVPEAYLHCKENPIYVFPEKKLRCISPNFHIHVSVSDLYIPMIGPPIFTAANRQTDRGNI